ncbi:OB-fold domain-containing protein [Nocardia sp. NPDC058176]|uniref:OB-fold domain-containing protein n=1 Tax=Nocardia sp. NPDC058176 TaxID=3346368 RepID=UPI0036DE19FF
MVSLRGQGTCTAATVVHRHHDPRRAAPFRIVQLTLDDGPVLRGVSVDDANTKVGDRVELTTVPCDVDDERFAIRVAPHGESN